jgi:predicted MFS family arabinose efflux permease
MNSAVTYAAAFVGTAVFGEIYTEIGFAAICWLACLSLASAALLALIGLRTQKTIPRKV